jgi:hypothetical protein
MFGRTNAQAHIAYYRGEDPCSGLLLDTPLELLDALGQQLLKGGRGDGLLQCRPQNECLPQQLLALHQPEYKRQ